jgi:hypothetical protein
VEERLITTNVYIGMKKKYNKEFNLVINQLLCDLYYSPINPTDVEKTINTVQEYRYIEFLKEHDLVYTNETKYLGYKLTLRKNGYEVFEKYKGWDDYRKKVIDKKNKVEEARNLAQRFWWLPIIISTIALLVAIFKHN